MSQAYIVPAIIPTSRQSVIDACGQLAFTSELHLDVVDGNFVPTISWPYEPAGAPASIGRQMAQFSLEVDLMVAQPLLAAEDWLHVGAERLVFHIETLSVAELQIFDGQTNCSIGIAANNDTPLDRLLAYAPYADYVQVMGIAEIGSQGQSFDERVFERITALQRAWPQLPISVDGSINQTTIARVAKAGVERLVVGSAIVQHADPAAAYRDLTLLIS